MRNPQVQYQHSAIPSHNETIVKCRWDSDVRPPEGTDDNVENGVAVIVEFHHCATFGFGSVIDRLVIDQLVILLAMPVHLRD